MKRIAVWTVLSLALVASPSPGGETGVIAPGAALEKRAGDFQFTDHEEIREVRLADWSEFATFGRIMRQTNMGGLHYRAVMHEELESVLRERGLLDSE